MLHFESFAEFWLRITVVMQYRDDKSPDEELCIKRFDLLDECKSSRLGCRACGCDRLMWLWLDTLKDLPVKQDSVMSGDRRIWWLLVSWAADGSTEWGQTVRRQLLQASGIVCRFRVGLKQWSYPSMSECFGGKCQWGHMWWRCVWVLAKNIWTELARSRRLCTLVKILICVHMGVCLNIHTVNPALPWT